MKSSALVAAFFASCTFVGAASAENLQQLNQLFASNQCQKCDLRGAGLVFTNLKRANLVGVDFSDANLSRANLSDSNLKNAKLRGASLQGANLSGANLTGADLSGADLNSSDLSGANLTGANLTGADLRRAYMQNANLQDAKLDDAYLRGAIGLPTTAIKAEDFLYWGIEEAQKGNHRAAMEHFNNAITVDEKYSTAYLWRATSRGHLGDRVGALEDAKTADTLFGTDGSKDGQKAAKELVAVLQKDPNEGSGGDWFGNLINGVGMTLFQFLLR